MNSLIQVLHGKTRFLAPLVGGSDLTFRLLCRQYGAEVTYTEMCIADYYLHRDTKQVKQYTFQFDPVRDRPLFLQLAGTSSGPIVEMANLPMFQGYIDGLDINCGCPQGFALEKGYGCAMLRDADNLVKTCQEIVNGVQYPVTVKLRLHENVETTIGIMKRLLSVGVQGFTVHGRYFWQKGEKRGLADWDALKSIKRAFPGVPIIGNGNIGEYEHFHRMVTELGVDGGMAGYGALIKPSLFQKEVVPIDDYIGAYLNLGRKYENQWIDILRHVEWMLKNHIRDPIVKGDLFQTKNMADLSSFLSTLEPPVNVNILPLPEREVDHIEYPPSLENMSDRQRKRVRKLEQKQELKKLKRQKSRIIKEQEASLQENPEGTSATQQPSQLFPHQDQTSTDGVSIHP